MDLEEQRLVLRAQAGDPVAFDELLRRYERPLFRHIQRLVRDEAASYDALQETYVAILRNIRKLRSRASFRPWAYGVATRTCLKLRSRRQRRAEVALPAEPPDLSPLPDALASAREELEAVLDHILLLPPRLRAVILLHFFEGFTLKQVAAALELSVGTVKSRLAGAREHVHTFLIKKQRFASALLVLSGVFEVGFFILMLMFMDFADRQQWFLLFGLLFVYTPSIVFAWRSAVKIDHLYYRLVDELKYES